MLEQIYQILTKNKLNWILDSGSLLGMVRDGEFLPWDRGIDISILYTPGDRENLELAVKELQTIGFYASQYTLGGVPYKYVITTKNLKKFRYNIDLHMFVKWNDMWVCPQISDHEIKNNFDKVKRFFWCVERGYTIVPGKKKGILEYIKYAVRQAYRLWITRKSYVKVEFGKFLPDKAYTYYWKIPSEYVEEVAEDEAFHYRKPGKTEEYLEFRYDDWHVPKKEWHFLSDDHSCVKCTSDEIYDMMKQYQ